MATRQRSVLDRVVVDPVTGCFEWQGMKTSGYGVVEVPGSRAAGERRTLMAHRVAYEETFGPIDAAHLHHMCENPGCIRPSHLAPVSHRTNNRASAQTFKHGVCGRGHADLRTRPNGRRYCRTCNTERVRRARGGDRND